MLQMAQSQRLGGEVDIHYSMIGLGSAMRVFSCVGNPRAHETLYLTRYNSDETWTLEFCRSLGLLRLLFLGTRVVYICVLSRCERTKVGFGLCSVLSEKGRLRMEVRDPSITQTLFY